MVDDPSSLALYEIHGFRDGWTENNKAGKTSVTAAAAATYKSVVYVYSCAYVACGSPSVLGSSTMPHTAPSNNSHVFTAELWQAITGLFGDNNIPDISLIGKFDITSWIIDTGATRYVTGNKSWLFDKHLIPNLLLVSQHNDNLQTFVTFTSSTCAIQDPMEKLIGMGVRQDGLYYFSQPVVISAVEASSSIMLWHRRKIHPLERVLKLLLQISSNKSSLNKRC